MRATGEGKEKLYSDSIFMERCFHRGAFLQLPVCVKLETDAHNKLLEVVRFSFLDAADWGHSSGADLKFIGMFVLSPAVVKH